MDDFRQTTDPLAVGLDRNTVVHPTGVVVADRLWDEYNGDCVSKGRPHDQQERPGPRHRAVAAHR